MPPFSLWQTSPVPPFQRLFQRRKQRHSADGGSGFALRELRAIAFAERHSAADCNRLFLEIHIAVDVQVEHFSPAEAGVEHHHRRQAEVVFLPCSANQRAFPRLQAAVSARFLAFGTLHARHRIANQRTVGHGVAEDAVHERGKLAHIGRGIAAQLVEDGLQVVRVDVADEPLPRVIGGKANHAGILLLQRHAAIGAVNFQPIQRIIQKGNSFEVVAEPHLLFLLVRIAGFHGFRLRFAVKLLVMVLHLEVAVGTLG